MGSVWHMGRSWIGIMNFSGFVSSSFFLGWWGLGCWRLRKMSWMTEGWEMGWDQVDTGKSSFRVSSCVSWKWVGRQLIWWNQMDSISSQLVSDLWGKRDFGFFLYVINWGGFWVSYILLIRRIDRVGHNWMDINQWPCAVVEPSFEVVEDRGFLCFRCFYLLPLACPQKKLLGWTLICSIWGSWRSMIPVRHTFHTGEGSKSGVLTLSVLVRHASSI